MRTVVFGDELEVCEDLWFLPQIIYIAKTFKVVNNAQYYYRRHLESLDSQEYGEGKILSVIDYITNVLRFMKSRDFDRGTTLTLLKKLEDYIKIIQRGCCMNGIYDDKFRALAGSIYRCRVMGRRNL